MTTLSKAMHDRIGRSIQQGRDEMRDPQLAEDSFMYHAMRLWYFENMGGEGPLPGDEETFSSLLCDFFNAGQAYWHTHEDQLRADHYECSACSKDEEPAYLRRLRNTAVQVETPPEDVRNSMFTSYVDGTNFRDASIKSIKVGDTVKLAFRADIPFNGPAKTIVERERLSVTVTKVNRKNFVGTLDAQPFRLPMAKGQTVRFTGDDVLFIYEWEPTADGGAVTPIRKTA